MPDSENKNRTRTEQAQAGMRIMACCLPESPDRNYDTQGRLTSLPRAHLSQPLLNRHDQRRVEDDLQKVSQIFPKTTNTTNHGWKVRLVL